MCTQTSQFNKSIIPARFQIAGCYADRNLGLTDDFLSSPTNFAVSSRGEREWPTDSVDNLGILFLYGRFCSCKQIVKIDSPAQEVHRLNSLENVHLVENIWQVRNSDLIVLIN